MREVGNVGSDLGRLVGRDAMRDMTKSARTKEVGAAGCWLAESGGSKKKRQECFSSNEEMEQAIQQLLEVWAKDFKRALQICVSKDVSSLCGTNNLSPVC